MTYVFWGSLFILFCIYGGYHLALAVLVPFIGRRRAENAAAQPDPWPTVSVIVGVHNEEGVIVSRMENLLALDYPKEKVEYIIASDGSTDRTVEIAQQYSRSGVVVFDFKGHQGRAIVHNLSVAKAKGEIIVFSDAETLFDADFLRRIIEPYADPDVGAVVGNLHYRQPGSSIAASEGLYWRFEKKLRLLESDAGILATSTGACNSVRKELWRDLTPIDDADFTMPLDVVLQGRRMHFAAEANAYDTPAASPREEYRVRIRQTSKNLRGTIQRWGVAGWIRHPLVSVGLLFHKILRWNTFLFMIAAFVSNIFLLDHGWPYVALFALQAAFYAAALLGAFIENAHPLMTVSFSFCVANAGMMVGVLRAATGRVAAKYKRAR